MTSLSKTLYNSNTIIFLIVLDIEALENERKRMFEALEKGRESFESFSDFVVRLYKMKGERGTYL